MEEFQIQTWQNEKMLHTEEPPQQALTNQILIKKNKKYCSFAFEHLSFHGFVNLKRIPEICAALNNLKNIIIEQSYIILLFYVLFKF